MNVLRGDAKPRVIASAVAVGALVAGAVLYVVQHRWLAGLKHVPPADAASELLIVFGWAVSAVCVAILWLSTWLWRSGSSVLRTARFPPPGMLVIRDTPVLQGDAALLRGRVLQLSGLVLLLCAIGLAALAWCLYGSFDYRESPIRTLREFDDLGFIKVTRP